MQNLFFCHVLLHMAELLFPAKIDKEFIAFQLLCANVCYTDQANFSPAMQSSNYLCLSFLLNNPYIIVALLGGWVMEGGGL